MIKKIATLLLVITLSSCTLKSNNSESQNSINSNDEVVLLLTGAPANQISFTNRIDSNSANASTANNEFDKKEKVKQFYIDFRSYLKSNLKDKFNDWNARVVEIENGDAEHSGVLLSLYVSTRTIEELGQSVNFRCFVPSSAAKLTDVIKGIKLNDIVKISGKFEYSDPLMIKMQSTTGTADIADIFNNPEFFVQLEKINKTR